jgi:hypothetical protein
MKLSKCVERDEMTEQKQSRMTDRAEAEQNDRKVDAEQTC